MSKPSEEAPSPGARACPNCGSEGTRRYCPDCGQELPRPDDYSLRAHLADLTDSIATAEGTALRTVRTLVLRPGALTADHLAGRRARYLRPIQLFLLVNVLLFLAAPRVPFFSYSLEQYLRFAPPSPSLAGGMVERAVGEVGPRGARTPAFVAYRERFDGMVEAQRKSLIILLAPAVALVLRLLFAPRRAPAGVPRRYGEHLVFALHGLTFVWLVLAALGVLTAAMMLGTRAFAGTVLSPAAGVLVPFALALLLAVPVHVVLAVRRAYALSLPRALAATVVVAAAFAVLLLAYRELLFFTTYYAL